MQALVMLLVVVPTYGVTILNHLRQSQPYTLDDILFYTCVIASPLFVILLLLLRLLCGERFGDLNLKSGRWWQDVLGGIGLSALTLGAMTLVGPLIGRVLPSAPEGGLAGFSRLARDPWRLALFLGPGLAFGAAGYEELTRVLFLSRWWKLAAESTWRWLGVLVSAGLFGLAHLYQGPAGMVSTAISGLILVIAYLRFGRVLPLTISNYLHDALHVVLGVVLLRSGAI
jgi:membrane protease YdiL (CAAX protease family)